MIDIYDIYALLSGGMVDARNDDITYLILSVFNSLVLINIM